MSIEKDFEKLTPEIYEPAHTRKRSIPKMEKDEFVAMFKETIINWIRTKEVEILQVLHENEYSWQGKSYVDSVRERDQLELAIGESRKKNNGGIDLDTVDEICLWGFNQRFPLRDKQATIEITGQAFEYLDREDYYSAVYKLMDISGVGISRASKILGLSDQDKLCVYDSRVGHALRDLRKDAAKLIKCPPDRSFKRDCDYTTQGGWAANYERLIWTIEIMRKYFRKKKQPLRAADIEMVLFVIGE